MKSNIITKQTARRYILGRQGLWPGRRWSGKTGTVLAIRQAEAVQIDTINVIARNHDLVLWSRVADYTPSHLNDLLYTERQFFDFGTILMVYPMDELIYWRAIMARLKEHLAARLSEHEQTAEYVRQELRTNGARGNRDFIGRERIPGGFRTIKDTGKVLYYLWLGGEIMTHSRRGFERIYDFQENVVGLARAEFKEEVSRAEPSPTEAVEIKEAEDFLGAKAMRDLGLGTAQEWARRATIMLHRRVSPSEGQKWLEAQVEKGSLAKVEVEGRKQICYLPAADLTLLNALEAGKVPEVWQPLGSTTNEEVNFIAPLDNVIWDRARTQAVFDFDYVWEVYKPAAIRRWGYYTMPILYGDKLVGRLNPKLDRKTKILSIDGFWLEDEKLREDAAFQAALQTGLAHFAHFHEAELGDRG